MQSTALPKRWLKFYPAGVAQEFEIPRVSVQSILLDTAKKYANSTALEFQGSKISYSKLDDLSNQFANSLRSLGLKKGSKIAIILPNIPQFILCFWGALKAGLIVVPCNPLYREREIEFQLKDSESEGIVILNNIYNNNDFYSGFEKARPRLSNVKYVFTTSLTDFLPPIKKQLAGPVKKIQTVKKPDTIDLVSFISNKPKTEPEIISINPDEDVAVIQYTGGTTGTSKGAMLTHTNLVSNAYMSRNWENDESNDRLLGVTPFFHIFGLTVCMISATLSGMEIVLLPSFHVKEVLETIAKHKITSFPGVATMYIAMINYPELSKYHIDSIRRCISGAAPLPLEVQRKFDKITGGHLVEGYGLTEASPVTHCNPLGDGALVKSGSIGIPVQGTDAKIVDSETGTREMPMGESGELAIKGPQVMKGYWKQPEETANVMRDGWLLTGDIARMDEDGYFYIVDRKKDMIDASGFKVWPREVEEVLYAHPAVKEAAVVGVRDDYRGESVKAFIVLKDKTATVDVDVIREYCKTQLAPYKVPRIVEFRDELPKTLVGKILRRKLREDAASADLSK
jgi:long-chain acyl-CoA synthetase